MSIPTKEIQLPPLFEKEDPEHYLQALVSFIKPYQWLINVHVVDFITHQQWEQLDPEWRTIFFAEDHDEDDEDAWFSSVIDLVAEDSKCYSLVEAKTDRYQVELMSAVIHTVAEKHGISSVMDLGAGQGYLSRALAFQHDFKVLAVDMSEIQTRGAQKFDKKASRLINKSNSDEHLAKLHHVTEKVTPENVSHILRKWGSAEEGEEKWLVCGLHACGDLSAMTMRLFAESQITCLVNVGCCYHYLSEEGDSAGFPLSRMLRANDYRMKTTARVLACQSPARWAIEKKESLKSFEQHFFKSLLQHILVEKGLATPSSPLVVGKVNKKKDFASYVSAALKRLNLPPDTIPLDEAEDYYRTMKTKGIDKQLIIVWTLRALLAPVLESIILVDRWLYLKEAVAANPSPNQGVWMWPLFDPSTSPRNVVFVASK
ncbi:hypothetical protein DFQ28_001635 [Apophysomyces sp. BC1034]|nr:hypothetical protein DFQ29_001061 [Apophysomyces sp. BC1021]KAG0190747.1 hypothetical protein DFQ28_001635 [Apophysomyces sp. BC1034]